MLLAASPAQDPMMTSLARRRSSLGLSMLFEHVVPSLPMSELETRASFSRILEDVSPTTAGVPLSPTAAVPCALGDVDMLKDPALADDTPSIDMFLTTVKSEIKTEKPDGGSGPPGHNRSSSAEAMATLQGLEVLESLDTTNFSGCAEEAITTSPVLREPATVPSVPSMSPRAPSPPPSPPHAPHSRSPSPSPSQFAHTRSASLGVAAATIRAGKSGGKTGVRRPRRQLPNSPAVKAAMPKPPRRSRRDPALQAIVAGLSPEKARLEKNRQSAKECRLRKKEYVTNLEAKVVEFERRDEDKSRELAMVRGQLADLKRQYDELLRASATGIATLS